MKTTRQLLLLLAVLFTGLLFAPAKLLAVDPLTVWQTRTSPTNINLTAVSYGNGTFVAVGEYYGIALTSPDGVTWTQRSTPIKNRYFYGGAFGNGVFVTVGDVGKIMTSPDGIAWTAQTSGSSVNLSSVSFLNNQFVAVGSYGAVLTSPNGVAWTPHNTANTNHWRGITYANGQYLLVGFVSPSEKALVGLSPDLNQINIGFPGFDQGLYCVAHGAGRFVAGGWAGNVLTSPNGTLWNTTNNIGFEHVHDMVFQNDVFVTVADGGTLKSSTTGTSWTTRAAGLSNKDYNAIAYGNGTFVVVGDTGTILQSGSFGAGASNVVLSHPVKNGSQVGLQFTGDIGQTYQIQSTQDFATWTPALNVVCTASPMTCSIPNQTADRAFYRVVKP